MRYIPFWISNGEICEPTPLPAYIADVTWYGRVKDIRVGWGVERCQNKESFREEMLNLRKLFLRYPEWKRKIKKLPKHKQDPAESLFPRLMYFPLPKSDYYWV